jgi:hypothetical protein
MVNRLERPHFDLCQPHRFAIPAIRPSLSAVHRPGLLCAFVRRYATGTASVTLQGETIMQLRAIASLCIFISAIIPAVQAATFSAGVDISEEVAPEKTGLRVYPGATLVVKNKGESDSANLQFSFGEYGLKVVVAKLRSADTPAKVAEFYRSDLARFGDVLDCGNPDSAKTAIARDKKSKVLNCDGDKPRKSGMLYKAGRKDDQHVVEIKPNGDGSEFSLVYVNVRSPQ